MAVCSHIHTKHINIPCGQNVGFVGVKLVVHIATTVNHEGLDWHTARTGETQITMYL